MSVLIGGKECHLGFDWSWWQPPRPLGSARDAGHRFGILKATEGDAYRDSRYRTHLDNVIGAGLLPGAYHFARPDWTDGGPYWDGRQEADLFLSVIDDRVRFCVLDLEATILDAARTTDYVLGFWDRIVESGRFPTREQRLTYVGFFFNWLHAAKVREHSCLWIPAYTGGNRPNPDPTTLAPPRWAADLWPEGWCLWQFSSTSTVAGLYPSDINVALATWLDAVETGMSQDHGSMPDNLEEDDGMQLWQIEGEDVVYAVAVAGQLGPCEAQTPSAFQGGVYYYAFSSQEDFLLSMGREKPIGVLHPGQEDALIGRLRTLPRVYQVA